jgi:sugar phosphate isomerase/epimerase
LVRRVRSSRAAASPNAKLLIDALQFFRSGATAGDLASVDPSLLPSMQLSDGPRAAPPSVEGRKIEARTARLLPGEGQLPIASLVEAMPRDIPISVEAPTRRLAGLPFPDQARIVADATRRFLATLRRDEG